MYIYELITPSDPITFRAKSDKVAFVCAFALGQGKAGCKRDDENGKEVSIPSLMMFDPEPEKSIKKFLGEGFAEFFKKNKAAIKEGFDSFAYGDIEDRKTYDDAVEAITDPEKLKAFKAKHEDRNRSSMSRWVQGAWDYAEKIKL